MQGMIVIEDIPHVDLIGWHGGFQWARTTLMTSIYSPPNHERIPNSSRFKEKQSLGIWDLLKITRVLSLTSHHVLHVWNNGRNIGAVNLYINEYFLPKTAPNPCNVTQHINKAKSCFALLSKIWNPLTLHQHRFVTIPCWYPHWGRGIG